MLSLKNTVKPYYSENEAAQILCISLKDLHKILDQHVFTADNPRPEEIELTHSEVLLLTVWAKPERGYNVVAMPSRD